MNENTGKTSSSLVVTEKSTHRSGGCVGIFFQLFDWNRRFAKKKLFSKKLLPPVARTKQASKKFKGNEKMPKSKLQLIADENSGGFPNVKKNGSRCVDLEKKHEMHTPSLVARLMGLESMPAVHRDKLKKASSSDNCDNGDEKLVGSHGGFDMEDLNLEKGGTKQELRPQKLQKTGSLGSLERRAVTRFGAEALQIKNVLSRARKHNHHHPPKLASPMKSPRISSGRNVSRSSRLIGAATKILEPGLQSTSRAKCALTYPSSMHYSPKDEILTEGIEVISPVALKQCSYNASSAKPLTGQTSCKNCGNLLDSVRPNVEEQPSAFPSFASNFVNATAQDLVRSKPRLPICSHEQERDVVFQRSPDQAIPFVAQEKDNMQSRIEPSMEGVPLSQEGQGQWHLLSQPCKPQKDESSCAALKHRTQTKDQMLLGRDRIPPRSKQCNLQSQRVSSTGNVVNGTKDFVALNRSLSGRTRPRVPTKVDSSKFDMERKASNGRDDSLPQLRNPVRKRRTLNVSGKNESTCFVSSTVAKQRNVQSDELTGRCMELNAHSVNHSCVKSRLAGQGDGKRADGNKETDAISFTFSSPIRHKAGIPTKMEEKWRDEDGKTSFQKPLPLRGDSLGVLLEQKLQELTCQEGDELTIGAPPKRSTAMILQELICALTAERSLSQDGHMFTEDIAFGAEAKMERFVGISREGHHLSPGSVLEASFSSSSLDESPVPGHKLRPYPVDYSYDHLQPSEPDADLLDSATSSDKGKTGSQVMTDFVKNVSNMFNLINQAGARLTGVKLYHAKEVILNAEMLFGTATLRNLDEMKGLLVSPCLLDELEAFSSDVWTNSDGFNGLEHTKEGKNLRGFLFDCVIECLDSKYGRYCNSGFKGWSRLPLGMNRKMLILKVGEEVRRWTDLVGMVPDEIIEWEMSHSLGKWTDFDIEAFEIGADIDEDILKILVEEIVMDLLECMLDSF